MSLSISYLLQESLVLSCKAEDYLLYMEPHLATCSPAERLQLKNCYRRIRNREYAKEQRQKRNKDILLLCNEIDRLRRENAELKETLRMFLAPIPAHS